MGLRARIWMAPRRSGKFVEPMVLAMMWSSRCNGILSSLRKIMLGPVRQRATIGVVLQISSPGHIRKLQQRLVALPVQFVEGIVEIILLLKLTDVPVSLSKDVKYRLTSVPVQQVFVTEVRDVKLGISILRSPQEHAVLLKGDISGAQPLFQCATLIAPGFSE